MKMEKEKKRKGENEKERNKNKKRNIILKCMENINILSAYVKIHGSRGGGPTSD